MESTKGMTMETTKGLKKSSVRRVINRKVTDWLSSIEDEKLRELAARDVVVTGGCISSMLMGTKVNDYDIYFKTMDTTEAIARYYVDKFNLTCKPTSAVGTEKTAVPEIRRTNVVNCKGEDEPRVMIYIKSAGVAAEDQDTYKYFESLRPDAAAEFADSLVKDKKDKTKPKYRPILMTQNAITLSDKVQLIIRFFGDPIHIHRNFDFIHATCWYEHTPQELVLPPKALELMLSKTLEYNGSLYPIASIFRSKKFIERGWSITAGQLLKIMWQISELNLKDWNVLQEQLTGVDAAYMQQLVQALQNVDADKINSSYVAEVIDRIFD
jgi:hypothetical protein